MAPEIARPDLRIADPSSTRERRAGETAPPLSPDAFDFEDGSLWADHCAEGPVSRRSLDAIRALLGREARPWTMRWEEDFQGLPQTVRSEAARLFGAHADDISLTPTTTGGLALIAHGFPWRPGDEVVAPLGEFPANAWPWKSIAARGVTFREVPLWDGHRSGAEAWTSTPPGAGLDPESRLLEAIGPKTRLLTVSWVRFQDGLRLDVARLARECRRRNVELVVDGVQGAGTLEICLNDLPGLSAFATGGHKGLLAPQGLGILWTTASFRNQLAPPGGWLSVEDATEFDRPSTDLDRGWAEDGSRLEMGVPNLIGCAALGSSLAMLADAGSRRIEGHIFARIHDLLAQLSGLARWTGEVERLGGLLEADRLGAILAFHHQGAGLQGLTARMKTGFDRGIYTSVREGYHRIALHGYHRRTDVERLARWLATEDR